MNMDIGIIGMAVMGQNLALNTESRGLKVSVYNRTAEKTKRFARERARGRQIKPAFKLNEFVGSLKRPRKIMLMVKAGIPVDSFIDKLIPLLDKGDIIIDGSNSHFENTNRRYKKCEDKGLLYIGTGISGGEYGALHGPSIMPGGHQRAYKEVEEVFAKIAAQVEDGPCCAYIGPKSAGHYVKMVHNGIEYGIMQVLAECYDLMNRALKMDAAEIGEIFSRWNNDRLSSYLVEITANIFSQKDVQTGKPLVELILDEAQQKGTGRWASKSALDLGVPVPTITASVGARTTSAFKRERAGIAKNLTGPSPQFNGGKGEFLARLEKACYLSIISSYVQGFHLLNEASRQFDYNLNLAEIARIWKGGCIIRAKLLKTFQEILKSEEGYMPLLAAGEIREFYNQDERAWRQLVAKAKEIGIPIPGMGASLDYYDSWRSEKLPANLIQAQRDYFGAHTYRRIDKDGEFHTKWQN